jgi:hypothetical protein
MESKIPTIISLGEGDIETGWIEDLRTVTLTPSCDRVSETILIWSRVIREKYLMIVY